MSAATQAVALAGTVALGLIGCTRPASIGPDPLPRRPVGALVTGTVTGSTGAAVEGATVHLRATRLRDGGQVAGRCEGGVVATDQGVTDARGRYAEIVLARTDEFTGCIVVEVHPPAGSPWRRQVESGARVRFRTLTPGAAPDTARVSVVLAAGGTGE